MTERQRAPLSDTILIALASLVDDAQTERREPSHSDLEFQFERAGLRGADPNVQGPPVGKAKRVRGVLSWALEHAADSGEILAASLVSLVRGKGGFRPGSPNYVGPHAVQEAIAAFREEGYELALDGELRPIVLDGMRGKELTAALESYIRRAKRGSQDAALLTGTGKDLVEATAAHVLQSRFGSYPDSANFPALLGQAFVSVGLATPEDAASASEEPKRKMERSAYQLACAINTLRNREGTGHGRPWLTSVEDDEARTAIQFMGVVAELLLTAHKKTS